MLTTRPVACTTHRRKAAVVSISIGGIQASEAPPVGPDMDSE
jgi:hypothetical protein